MSAAVKRACDACHRRKVKCDGVNPCRNCASSRLSCTYNAIPQKKGPKGSRAKVISELREHQRHFSFSTKTQSRTNDAASISAPFTPTHGLLTSDLVKLCVDFFFANMYPAMPILNRQRLEQDAMSLDATLDTYCLLSSLSAFMFLQPGISAPALDPYGLDNIPGSSIMTATLLLEETLRVRKSCDYMSNPTLYTLATEYFLFACHYGLDLHDKAWCNLRDATTLIHLARMDREEAYQAVDKADATCLRRLYWLLYAAERAYALQYDRPLSLKANIDLPTPTEDLSEPVATQLIESLFTITCDVMDVLALMPSSGYAFSASPRDHVNQLANILAMLRMGEHRFAPLLLAKVHEILPRLINPMLQSPPDVAFDVDIFDGFGNAGMVPQQYVPLEEFKTDGSSSAEGAPSLQDVHSPFLSSPPIMSPGMDLSHNIKSEFSPIADLMHSQPSVASCITTLFAEGGLHCDQQQQQTSPAIQNLHRQPQISQQQQIHHQHLHQQRLASQQSQHHQMSPRCRQHVSGQHFEQQQPHPQSASILTLQSLGNNLSVRPCEDGGFEASPAMSISRHQPIDQSQKISVFNDQSFTQPMNGVNTNSNANTAFQIQQQPAGYGISAQQRNTGDLQLLRRSSSNCNAVGFINVNNLGTELDLNTLG
ncbi:hypothetical protein SEPCBS119000_006574 [Sporothrix epigloea]|uniref:Zn(2)-C6 fungal-type domain-containing protein n=1 Tax=Sporothrix epigloea TaxID=1892477 RepID=A0ABP0E6W7_9PEZI